VAAKTIVHEFKKNERETVRTSVAEFAGRQVVDVRVWMPRSSDEVLVPCPKGLTIDRRLLPDLIEAIRCASACDAGAARGLDAKARAERDCGPRGAA
jgi:hypothetical protein